MMITTTVLAMAPILLNMPRPAQYDIPPTVRHKQNNYPVDHQQLRRGLAG